MKPVLLLFVLALPLVAHASTNNCAGVGNGTACTTECIMSGTCQGSMCVPTTVRPNGSSCSSGDKCTVNDSCQNGQCVSGGAIMCPGADACHSARCLRNFGCVVIETCMPDLAVPPIDMSTSDLSANADAGLHDMALSNPDACYMPPGSEFLVCHGDGGPVVIADLGTADFATPPSHDLASSDLLAADMTRYGHLRGSRPGDCDVAPGARPTMPLALFFLALVGLAARLRRA